MLNSEIVVSKPYICSMLERLDKILVQRKLISSRTRAEQIIREVGVKVNGKLITKTGKKFPEDCTIELVAEEIPWVSRAALKLIEALDHWQLPVKDGVFLDIGASTGGFTEVLLHRGASKVYSVDVGTGQLHASLREESRVVNLEKTHVRELNNRLIPDKVDGCVIDVSFISLEKVLPFVQNFIKESGYIVALVKPQFEVGKENVGKGGIVRDKKLYPVVIEKLRNLAITNQLVYREHIESPILGGDGNKEFLMYLIKQ